MLDAQNVNARASFLSELVTGTGDDSYGDPVEYTDWGPVFQGVPVLYSPQGTSYVTQETGDRVAREERVIAPVGIARPVDVDDLNLGVRLGTGDRIVVKHYGRTHEWRIESFQSRTLDGTEGYAQLGLEDFGD